MFLAALMFDTPSQEAQMASRTLCSQKAIQVACTTIQEELALVARSQLDTNLREHLTMLHAWFVDNKTRLVSKIINNLDGIYMPGSGTKTKTSTSKNSTGPTDTCIVQKMPDCALTCAFMA